MESIKMMGVKEYSKGNDVHLTMEVLDNGMQRYTISAGYAKEGYSNTRVDLEQVIIWLRLNKPELIR